VAGFIPIRYKARGIRRKVRRTAYPSFAVGPEFNGASAFDPLTLLVNGISVAPDLVILGKDAAAGGWATHRYPASPVTLALQSGTAPTYDNGSPFRGVLDGSVYFNSGGWFKDTGGTLGAVTTEDMVVVWVGSSDLAGNYHPVGKCDTAGWYLYFANTGAVFFILDYGGGTVSASAPLVSAGARQLFVGCVNRDENSTNGMRVYAGPNGGTAVNPYAAVGSLADASAYFGAGLGATGATALAGSFDFFALWKQSNWFAAGATGLAQMDALALDLTRRLCGLRALVGWADRDPSSAGRNCVDWAEEVDAGSPSIYKVGIDLLAPAQRTDDGGRVVAGYRADPQRTNRVQNSSDLTQPSWTKRGACSVNRQAVGSGPGPERVANRVSGLGTWTVDDAYQVVSGYGASVALWNKVWVKRVSTSGTLVFQNPSGVAQGKWSIDLSALPDEWVAIDSKHPAVTINNAYVSNASNSAGFILFAGSGGPLTVDIWNVGQCEGGPMGSDIVTGAGVGTRLASALGYPATAQIGTQEGTIVWEGFLHKEQAPTTRYLFSLTDGTDSERILVWLQASTSVLRLTSTASSSSTTGAGSTNVLTPGKVIRVAVVYRKGVVQLWLNGALEIQITPASLPSGLSLINPGQSRANAEHAIGIVSRMGFYKEAVLHPAMLGGVI